VREDQPLKTFCNNGSKRNLQREVEDVGEDLRQLFCTGPKHSARDAVRAGSFMCILLTQDGAHVTGGKCEWQVVRCEHSFDGWFCVSTIKASIKVV